MSARRLLADYDLRVSGDQLPGAVKDWFLAQLRGLSRPDDPTAGLRPLCIGRGHHKLWLYLMRGAAGDRYHLVLQEKKIVADDRQAFRRLGVSEREAEVLLWLTCGKTNPEIGKILGVSPGTVRRHLENIFPKLGVENRHAAALAAMQAQARQDLPG